MLTSRSDAAEEVLEISFPLNFGMSTVELLEPIYTNQQK